MSASEWLFWAMVLGSVYPYAIYPVLVRFLALVLHRRVFADVDHTPRVTVVIAAFNEAAGIEATVSNKLNQDYPPELLDVIVVSDESVDGTDDIVMKFVSGPEPRVRLIRQAPRQGKTAALNLAVPEARGEIVVFSDANSLYRPDAIRHLVANFADRSVGYVTGKMIYTNADGSLVGDGCSAFMRYENWLRVGETCIGSVVGVDGGVDAVRRSLYPRMRPDQLPDFVLPLSVVEQGYRAVFEPRAILMEDTLSDSESELRMRIRVALRAFWALRDKRRLLNPLHGTLFAWQLWSHKVLRYLSFFPLAVGIPLNWLLWPYGDVYRIMACGQVLIVGLALSAVVGPKRLRSAALSRYCNYFLLLNYASALAFLRFLLGQKQVMWSPRTG